MQKFRRTRKRGAGRIQTVPLRWRNARDLPPSWNICPWASPGLTPSRHGFFEAAQSLTPSVLARPQALGASHDADFGSQWAPRRGRRPVGASGGAPRSSECFVAPREPRAACHRHRSAPRVSVRRRPHPRCPVTSAARSEANGRGASRCLCQVNVSGSSLEVTDTSLGPPWRRSA